MAQVRLAPHHTHLYTINLACPSACRPVITRLAKLHGHTSLKDPRTPYVLSAIAIVLRLLCFFILAMLFELKNALPTFVSILCTSQPCTHATLQALRDTMSILTTDLASLKNPPHSVF